MHKHGIKIIGTGHCLPKFVVRNDDFSAFLETDDEWISSRTGIKQRHFNIGGSNHAMSSVAAREAIVSAGISPDEIDMVVASTSTPDYFYPSLSCLVQGAVGAVNAFAIDVASACTGFVNALDIARNYLATGSAKTVLVVAGEMVSRQVDFTDRASCVLFGDGAGAIVVQAADKPYASYLGAAGESVDDMAICFEVDYRSNNPFDKGGKQDIKSTLAIQGKGVYKFATEIMPKAVHAVCDKAGVNLSEIDLLIPHQANIRIISTALKGIDIEKEKVYTNIEATGNVSSACIPICLDELNRAGKLKSGMKLCLVAFGGGLTYGSIIMEL